MNTASKRVASAGNKGDRVRSDCFVAIELTDKGGLEIDLQSKVMVTFGKAIEKLAIDILNFYEIKNAKVQIADTGALPFVLEARIEAAIKQLIKTDKEYLLELIPENQYQTEKDIFRFSRLYLPGNTPSLMINAGIHKPNGIILDLEDAVAPDKKFEASFVVRNALRQVNYYGAERMVRINQIPLGLDDLEFIVPHFANLILVPKCESADDLHQVNNKINKLKKQYNIDNDVWLMPIIESAKGVMNAYAIAQAADNVVAMAIGLEDYTADLGTMRTFAGNESFFARSMVVTASIAAGIQPIDSVFSDVANMEALADNVRTSKSLGFDGMGCIHPRQIAVIHENFAPEEAEIEKAKKIVIAFNDAKEKGLGVVSLGSKMIDAPVVKRAQNTIRLAINTEKLSKDWINN